MPLTEIGHIIDHRRIKGKAGYDILRPSRPNAFVLSASSEPTTACNPSRVLQRSQRGPWYRITEALSGVASDIMDLDPHGANGTSPDQCRTTDGIAGVTSNTMDLGSHGANGTLPDQCQTTDGTCQMTRRPPVTPRAQQGGGKLT
jgi:hypothetical protein